jgi:cytosine deaminase
MTAFDIVIRNARLRKTGDATVDIGIADGHIAAIDTALSAAARDEIDAHGHLVTESYVNPHLHLCKVWTLPMMAEEALKSYVADSMANSRNAIDLASKVKEKYDAAWIIPNARRAVAMAAAHGCLHIRAFADVDTKARLEGVKAVLAVRDEFRGLVDVQVVAFAQDGLAREPGADTLMREAMKLGADVVGGIPWIESSDADRRRHVSFCFDLAQEFGKDVSMLLDDVGDPNMRTLEMMAREAMRRGWQGRALAHHCRAMELYPPDVFAALVVLLREARVAVVSDPHTGPLHARVQKLLAQGVSVCLGQDDISDAYYPFGRNSMPEVAFLAAHLLWMTTRAEIETLYDMITVAPARAMNVGASGITVGAPAHLVLLDQPDVVEALRFHAQPREVISHGRRVDLPRMRALAGL